MKTPPLSSSTRIEAGLVLRRLQRGKSLGLPHSRPIPSTGRRIHELRIPDEDSTWRVVYRIDSDTIVIGGVFQKKTQETPQAVMRTCKAGFSSYDDITGDKR